MNAQYHVASINTQEGVSHNYEVAPRDRGVSSSFPIGSTNINKARPSCTGPLSIKFPHYYCNCLQASAKNQISTLQQSSALSLAISVLLRLSRSHTRILAGLEPLNCHHARNYQRQR